MTIPAWITNQPHANKRVGKRVKGIADSVGLPKLTDESVDSLLVETGFTDLNITQAQEKTLKAALAYLYSLLSQPDGISQEQVVRLVNALASKAAVSNVSVTMPIVFTMPEPKVLPVNTPVNAIEGSYEVIDGRTL